MDGLVQYLLSLQSPNGNIQLCKYSPINAVIVYAPYQEITFGFAPTSGNYAFIAFQYRESPYIVPGALKLEAWQSGIQFFWTALGGTLTEEPHTMWAVITAQQPSVTKVTNLTGLWQEEEFFQEVIVVQSEDDYKIVLKAIRDWYSNYGIVAAIKDLQAALKGGG